MYNFWFSYKVCSLHHRLLERHTKSLVEVSFQFLYFHFSTIKYFQFMKFIIYKDFKTISQCSGNGTWSNNEISSVYICIAFYPPTFGWALSLVESWDLCSRKFRFPFQWRNPSIHLSKYLDGTLRRRATKNKSKLNY